MTDSQTIPDAILAAAAELTNATIRNYERNQPAYIARDAIAKAIYDAVMAERERCARIADDEAAGRDWQRADANAHNDKRAARDFESMKIEAVQIASAIRATPKAEEA